MEHPGDDDGVAVADSYTGVVADPKQSWSAQVGQYLSMALVIPVSTMVGFTIGYLLDRAAGTSFLKIVFLFLGTAAGFVQLYRQLSRDTRNDGS